MQEWRHGIWPRTTYVHTFRDDQGQRYRWNGTSPVPVNLRGYRYPGRYPVLQGIPLTFNANVREIWPDGTAIISRPYIKLDRQPEATRRAYAREFRIALEELGLDEHDECEAGVSFLTSMTHLERRFSHGHDPGRGVFFSRA